MHTWPDAAKANKWGNTPLHDACYSGASSDTISLLVATWPDAVKVKSTREDKETPLHVACRGGASLDTISLLLGMWPEAIEEKNSYNQLPLHVACSKKASLDAIFLLVGNRHDTIKRKDNFDCTPLHEACSCASSIDVISFLLKCCPDAIKEKNRDGETPLHAACRLGYRASLKTISLLLKIWPGALNEKNRNNETPFHIAFSDEGPIEIILLLLDAWLELPGNRNSHRVNSLINDAPRYITTRLFRVSSLFGDELSVTSQEELMSYFISIKWQKGALLAINKYPSYVKNMELHTEVMADFLSLAGKYCSLATMWEVIINEQELLKGVKCL
uniref:Uncharacterized protein n=1 Tax=Ditylum brightwellii TaxID=49249 RepID=A0A7S4SLF8_9STRA